MRCYFHEVRLVLMLMMIGNKVTTLFFNIRGYGRSWPIQVRIMITRIYFR